MIATRQQPAEQRVHLSDISWRTYLELMGEDEHDGRFAYDDGELEIMTVGYEHETSKKLVSRLIESYTLFRDIDIVSAGNFTMLREDLRKGIEADDCYYIQSAADLREPMKVELPEDPPPDLAVEVDLTHPTIDKLGIYAAIGVGEVWRWNGERLDVLRRNDAKGFRRVDASICLPDFPLDAVPARLRPAAAGLVRHKDPAVLPELAARVIRRRLAGCPRNPFP